MEKRIHGRVKQQMEKNQRDYYLNEQMKAIQKELGQGDDGNDVTDDYEKKIEAARMSPEAKDKALEELNKLRQMSPMSAEATVVRAYLDTLISLPWSKKTRVSSNIPKAKKILDEDHYGLEKVKERILEYLAVQGRVTKVKANRSPAQPAASSRVSLSAACMMKRKSAVIAGPTSARCRARSCRT